MGNIQLLCWIEFDTSPICGYDCSDGEGGDCKIHEVIMKEGGMGRLEIEEGLIEIEEDLILSYYY